MMCLTDKQGQSKIDEPHLNVVFAQIDAHQLTIQPTNQLTD